MPEHCITLPIVHFDHNVKIYYIIYVMYIYIYISYTFKKDFILSAQYECDLKYFTFFRFVNSTAYYGLSWSTGDLGGDTRFVFILMGLVEFPAYTFLLLTLNRWGRKINISGFLILAGLSLLATLVVIESKMSTYLLNKYIHLVPSYHIYQILHMRFFYLFNDGH